MSAAALTLEPPILTAVAVAAAPETPAPILRDQGRQAASSERHKDTPTPLVERSVLRQRAFALHCQGLRSPAIATRLGVPERTVRFWIASTRADVQADSPASHADQLTDAVEGLRELLAAAWHAYDRDLSIEDDLLLGRYDYLKTRRVRHSSPHPAAAPDAPKESESQIISETYIRPRFTSRAPTYLRLAFAVQREIARLLGLYRHPQTLPSAQSHIPATTATRSKLARFTSGNVLHAESAGDVTPAAASAALAKTSFPAKTATRSLAKSPIPAKTATCDRTADGSPAFPSRDWPQRLRHGASPFQIPLPAKAATPSLARTQIPAKTATPHRTTTDASLALAPVRDWPRGFSPRSSSCSSPPTSAMPAPLVYTPPSSGASRAPTQSGADRRSVSV